MLAVIDGKQRRCQRKAPAEQLLFKVAPQLN
jgi:hypothetical protein